MIDILVHFHALFTANFALKTISGTIQVNTIEDGNHDSIGGVLLGNINSSTGVSHDYSQDAGSAAAAGTFDTIGADFASTTGALVNSDGIIANLGLLNVVYDEGSNGDAGDGFGVSTPRQ